MKKSLSTKKKNTNKTKNKPKTKTNNNKKQKRTKKLILNKKTKSSKIVNSNKYKKYLQNRIKYNIHKFKMGSYKSKKQAIAISYNQTNTFFNLY